MSNAINDLFTDDQYCYDEINRIRGEVFCKIGATQAQWKAAFDTLAKMYLHCSENLKTTVLSQIHEGQTREIMVAFALD